MSTLDVLYSKKRKYNTLRNRLEDIIDDLNKSISYIDDASDFCVSSFKIDGESADKDEIISIKNRLINTRNTLRDKVYPKVLSTIREIKTDISVEENV